MNLDEKRELVFTRDNYICQVCGKHLSNGRAQLAHLIGNTKANRRRYGNEVIDDLSNVLSTCSLECNGRCNVGVNHVFLIRNLISTYSLCMSDSKRISLIKGMLKKEGYL